LYNNHSPKREVQLFARDDTKRCSAKASLELRGYAEAVTYLGNKCNLYLYLQNARIFQARGSSKMPESTRPRVQRTFPSAQLLEARIARATLAVMAHREFAQSLRQFCCLVPDAYRLEPGLTRAIGDLGSLITVGAILAKQGQHNATLTTVQRIVCDRLASQRRVRAIVGELERTQAIARVVAAGDSRSRQIIVGGWLPGALAAWGNAYASSARPWLSALPILTPALASWGMKLLAGWALAYEQSGFLLADGHPVVSMFTNRLGGHPMILQIIGSAVPLPDGTAFASFSRKAASRSFGLSRTHFTAILVRSERLGWMHRQGKGTQLLLTEPVYQELRSWVAREIAWIIELMGDGIS
jgi:hypothetical protein